MAEDFDDGLHDQDYYCPHSQQNDSLEQEKPNVQEYLFDQSINSDGNNLAQDIQDKNHEGSHNDYADDEDKVVIEDEDHPLMP